MAGVVVRYNERMNNHAIKNLAQQYLSGFGNDHLEAFDKVYDLTTEDPEGAWLLVVELVHQATTDESLAIVAAGPLEDMICNHPDVVIDRVLDFAKNNTRFMKCLRGVWGGNRMPLEIRKRIDKVVEKEPLC